MSGSFLTCEYGEEESQSYFHQHDDKNSHSDESKVFSEKLLGLNNKQVQLGWWQRMKLKGKL